MKKVLFSFLLILGGLYLILSFLDRDGNYTIEQRLWKINKQLLEVAKDPAVVPDQKFADIAEQYAQLVKDFPRSKLSSRAQILQAQVYIVKKDYETARKKLQEVFTLYPDNESVLAEAQMAIAKTYELGGDMASAEKAYKVLIEKYPTSNAGLGTPIYLVNYFREKNNTAKFIDTFNEAVSHYKKLAEENPNSELEFNSLRFLANCYFLHKNWREGLDVFGDILLKYPNPRAASQIVQTINAISVIELKDFNVPIEIYGNILKQKPDHPLAKNLEKMIAGFNELKDKNVKITTKEEL